MDAIDGFENAFLDFKYAREKAGAPAPGSYPREQAEKAITWTLLYHILPQPVDRISLGTNTTFATALSDGLGALDNEAQRIRVLTPISYLNLINYRASVQNVTVTSNGKLAFD